ncbi:interleukin-4 isoform X2 [Otolemur garnettii]|uniref:interleukin-4 isoform X2 n=1 Tax=Otolemur garnettii TaxID=30611 RepID=UPI000C7EAA2E|nr:interleukin-4 isoform X2 [Otolemur garnettii]
MGLTSQLIPSLLCLLACTGNFVHGHKRGIVLKECIKALNILTENKNTTEKEIFCRAATVLRQVYSHHQKEPCRGATERQQLYRHQQVIRFLKGLDRNLCSLANSRYCPVNDAMQSTLKDFLERLKTTMKEKYSKYWS